MKVAIVGGHLTPALSVIEKLPKDVEVIYIGRKYALEGEGALSLEYKTITDKGIKFVELKTGRLQRSLTRQTIPSLFKIPGGLFQALAILTRNAPDVVVGFGGYVSVPVGVASYILGLPLVIHEQTLESGLSNRILSKFAKRICISFESSKKFFPAKKTVLTGNPIRKTILESDKKIKLPDGYPVVFITGGSLGSHAINVLAEGAIEKLLRKYVVVHQTGGSEEFKDYDRLSGKREKLPDELKERYVLSKFFETDLIGSVFRKADLVVCRAGVNTVSELIILKKPSFLIPLPVSQRNEQFKNANLLKRLGLGEVGDQRHLTPKEFANTIDQMLSDIEKYKPKKLDIDFPKDAASKIVEEIYAASKKSN